MTARELVEAAIFRHERFGERLHAYSLWAPEQARAVDEDSPVIAVHTEDQVVIVMMSSQANPRDAELISLTMTVVSHIREIFALSQ